MQKQRSVIFGAGDTGERIYDMVKDERDVLFFVDNDKDKWAKKFLGLEVRPPECLREYDAYDEVIIGTLYATDVFLSQLADLGVPVKKCNTSYAMALVQSELAEKSFYYDLLVYLGLYRQEEYEARWREIKQKYDAIKIFKLAVDTIGESIGRYCAIRHNETDEPNVLKVFMPAMLKGRNRKQERYRICNKELIKLLNQHIYAPMGEDALFWSYVLKNHPDDVDTSELEKYSSRNPYPTYEVDPYQHDFTFADEDVRFAEAQAGRMQLKKDFVCISARTGTYNNVTLGHDFDTAFRNMDFKAYLEMIDYLGKQGLQTVRMGRGEEPLERPIDNCVDYAGGYAGDFMDLHLASHCKFMVANNSGIASLAFLFGKPVALVDVAPVSFGQGACQFTRDDIYIPKKYFDVHKGRYLSLMEMVEIEQKCLVWDRKYEEAGIRFEDNTPEEIQETVAEFLARLNGTWVETEEDLTNYGQYKKIYKKMSEITKANAKIWNGAPFPYRLSATYLRKNRYLLE